MKMLIETAISPDVFAHPEKVGILDFIIGYNKGIFLSEVPNKTPLMDKKWAQQCKVFIEQVHIDQVLQKRMKHTLRKWIDPTSSEQCSIQNYARRSFLIQNDETWENHLKSLHNNYLFDSVIVSENLSIVNEVNLNDSEALSSQSEQLQTNHYERFVKNNSFINSFFEIFLPYSQTILISDKYLLNLSVTRSFRSFEAIIEKVNNSPWIKELTIISKNDLDGVSTEKDRSLELVSRLNINFNLNLYICDSRKMNHDRSVILDKMGFSLGGSLDLDSNQEIGITRFGKNDFIKTRNRLLDEVLPESSLLYSYQVAS